MEDIFFRFTTRFPEGMLVQTSSLGILDMMLVELRQGEIFVTIDFGRGKEESVHVGDNLDDNQWHSVHVVRHENTLSLTVDSERVEGKFGLC